MLEVFKTCGAADVAALPTIRRRVADRTTREQAAITLKTAVPLEETRQAP
jgi:hypothetical protein